MRKGYEHIEKIDRELMWLDAYGLQEPRNEIRRNKGIWAPDSGPCTTKTARKPCKLPSGSKMYSFANREKVMHLGDVALQLKCENGFSIWLPVITRPRSLSPCRSFKSCFGYMELAWG